MPDDKSTSDIRNSHVSSELIQTPGQAEAHAGATWSQSGFSADEAGVAGVDVARYLHSFRRRWLVAVVIALPVAAAALYCAWTFQPRTYTSTAILRLAANETTL